MRLIVEPAWAGQANTLWLHRVVQTGSSIRVIMIQLDVTVPSNPLGLSPGTVVNVASAQVNVN